SVDGACGCCAWGEGGGVAGWAVTDTPDVVAEAGPTVPGSWRNSPPPPVTGRSRPVSGWSATTAAAGPPAPSRRPRSGDAIGGGSSSPEVRRDDPGIGARRRVEPLSTLAPTDDR